MFTYYLAIFLIFTAVMAVWHWRISIAVELKVNLIPDHQEVLLIILPFNCPKLMWKFIYYNQSHKGDWGLKDLGVLTEWWREGADIKLLSRLNQLKTKYVAKWNSFILFLNKYVRIIRIGDDIKWHHLKWTSNIGLYDAMQTALAAGMLWSLKGLALTYLNAKHQGIFYEVNVSPDFDRLIIRTSLDCIVKVRLAHIILIIGFLLALKLRRYCHGILSRKTGTPYRGFNENSYAEY